MVMGTRRRESFMHPSMRTTCHIFLPPPAAGGAAGNHAGGREHAVPPVMRQHGWGTHQAGAGAGTGLVWQCKLRYPGLDWRLVIRNQPIRR